MLAGAVDSAGIGEFLDDVLSVEDVGVFKPHASVYQLVPDRFDCGRDEVLFVSSNGWDAAAAAGFGFRCVWVNRAGEPMDRLPWTPDQVLTRPDHHSRACAGILMPKFTISRRLAASLFRRGRGHAGPVPVRPDPRSRRDFDYLAPHLPGCRG